MPDCTITRTHRRGKKLDRRDWEEPIPGPINLSTIRHAELHLEVQCLSLVRINAPDSIPCLWDPRWLTFQSEGGMIVVGFEETDNSRYYQGWYVRWT